MRAFVIVDLGFGDSGKGLLTDFLVRHFNAGLVVRYNGGAQAGHNVMAPDGRHHTFSQFSSGTLVPGVRTYLSKHVVIHPGALLVEGEILQSKGVRDAFARLRMSDQALVITPFHQAANRIREWARGEERHGSCGVGVGEAVEDALENDGDSVRAGDLVNSTVLRRKLRRIREHKLAQLDGLDRSTVDLHAGAWEVFQSDEIIDRWISTVSRLGELGLIVPDTVLQRWLAQAETVIFEGAQGVLLDADAGFHPFTTWSRCTSGNAYDLVRTLAPAAQVFQIGVLRSYAVRHGPGPLPTETDVLRSVVFDHNRLNEWQGPVRYGWWDAVLARYALQVNGGVDALAITHLDVLSQLERWVYAAGYPGTLPFDPRLVDGPQSTNVIGYLQLPRDLSLAERVQFTQALDTIRPVLENCASDRAQVLGKIESLLNQPVGIISSGPRAEQVQIVNPLP